MRIGALTHLDYQSVNRASQQGSGRELMKRRYFFGHSLHVSLGNQRYFFEAASAVRTFSSSASNERAAGAGVPAAAANLTGKLCLC